MHPRTIIANAASLALLTLDLTGIAAYLAGGIGQRYSGPSWMPVAIMLIAAASACAIPLSTARRALRARSAA